MTRQILVLFAFDCNSNNLNSLQLKEKGGTSNGKPEAAEELQEAIFLAEETHPGICDSLVAELVQRLQR